MSDPLHRASKVTDSTIKEISCSSGGNSNRRKPKKTSFQIQQVINEIGKMLSAGKPDREIMDQLQIKRSQYYEYKSKLFQQSAELFDRFNDENRDSLIFHKELLSERLTRLYNRAELELTQNASPQGGSYRASIYLAAQNIAIILLLCAIRNVLLTSLTIVTVQSVVHFLLQLDSSHQKFFTLMIMVRTSFQQETFIHL